MPNNSYGILDTRNGIGYSVSFETETESEKSVGFSSTGVPKFIYIKNVPQIIKKTTFNVIMSGDEWNSLISQMANAYKAIDTSPTGLFIESANPSGGLLIINGREYFAGSYVEADYSALNINPPPDEYKIIINNSASVSPSGFLPDGTSYFSSNQFGKTFNRTSIISIDASNSIRVGTTGFGGIITSKSLSNQRIIGDKVYVDMSLQISELNASITI